MKHKTLPLLALAASLSLLLACNSADTDKTNPEVSVKAVQFRIARPTNQLKEVVNFYKEGLGLQELGHFENHSGYNGVMLGLPDKTYHLEFTQQEQASPLPAPTKEHLLVLYYDNGEEYKKANDRLQNYGAHPVEPENPYWIGKSETYEDPDGWRIVLFNGTYTP